MDVVVGAIDDLIVSKELLGREKDLEHLPELRQVASGLCADVGLEIGEELRLNRTEPEPPGLGP